MLSSNSKNVLGLHPVSGRGLSGYSIFSKYRDIHVRLISDIQLAVSVKSCLCICPPTNWQLVQSALCPLPCGSWDRIQCYNPVTLAWINRKKMGGSDKTGLFVIFIIFKA